MSLGQSGCAGGFIPLPAVIVQAVAEPPMYAMLSLKKSATASARTVQAV